MAFWHQQRMSLLLTFAVLSVVAATPPSVAPSSSPTMHWFAKGEADDGTTMTISLATVGLGGAVTLFLVLYCIRKGQKEAARLKAAKG